MTKPTPLTDARIERIFHVIKAREISFTAFALEIGVQYRYAVKIFKHREHMPSAEVGFMIDDWLAQHEPEGGSRLFHLLAVGKKKRNEILNNGKVKAASQKPHINRSKKDK